MNSRRYTCAAAAGCLALWAALALWFGQRDLQISLALASPGASWARWFEIYGEHPAMLLVWTAGQLLFSAARLLPARTRLLQRLLALAVQLTAGLALVHMTAGRGLGMELSALQWALAVLLLAAAAIAAQLALLRMPAERLTRLHRAAWLTLLLVGGELALVHSLKSVWGRVRFRDLLPGYTDYTAWYTPMGRTGNRSFPSSHAANSWALLLLPVYASAALARPAILRAAWIAALLWGLATSFSRLVAGAHYASDLLVGASITILLFLLLWRYMPLELPYSGMKSYRGQRGQDPSGPDVRL
ncbi:PAP2 superfamily protein [Paenibacillus sp. UNCCL117]|uniref:phosphatase PAP2 family protein n=1 Tax=unclassified Paenibacillus TaxID=185978 RepID=UPI00088F5B62|nr:MULTISPECIES: phosphatase PAP2 family protein [unclassified Paenibacillus]SDD77349.1 PAP2 superfamily protein [Paenibacillus sp. cl123]SFW52699.1 PAP2 superfamily protein [Paenibacillus sp. UNCCL117]